MEWHFVLSAGLSLWNVIFVYSSGLMLWNDILFIQHDLGYGMTFCSFSRTEVME